MYVSAHHATSRIRAHARSLTAIACMTAAVLGCSACVASAATLPRLRLMDGETPTRTAAANRLSTTEAPPTNKECLAACAAGAGIGGGLGAAGGRFGVAIGAAVGCSVAVWYIGCLDTPPAPPSYSDARDCGCDYDGGWPAETSPTDSEDYGGSFAGGDFGGSGGDYGSSGGGGGGGRLIEDSES